MLLRKNHSIKISARYMPDMLMACFYAQKTRTEAALKGITHQLTRSRGDISSIKYVKLVDKDTETEQGLQTVMLLSLPKFRPEIHLQNLNYKR